MGFYSGGGECGFCVNVFEEAVLSRFENVATAGAIEWTEELRSVAGRWVVTADDVETFFAAGLVGDGLGALLDELEQRSHDSQ